MFNGEFILFQTILKINDFTFINNVGTSEHEIIITIHCNKIK